jgi:hypothetical protein
MSATVEAKIKISAAEFERAVWPHFSQQLGGGTLVPVESVTESGFATLLDTLGMTDAWQVVEPEGMRALATRCQFNGPNWHSWTVRYQRPSGRLTEWHKLTQHGVWQLPHYIIQAYISSVGGQLLGAAAIKTRDLQVMLINGWTGPVRRNREDGVLFLPIYWDEAEAQGFQILRVDE